MYDKQCPHCGRVYDKEVEHTCCASTYDKDHWNRRKEPFTFRADVAHTEGDLISTGFALLAGDGDNWS